jgi:signal transduction histidine kinase
MKFFIQIIDNGTGITPDDMEKIGQRYGIFFNLIDPFI